MAFFSAGEFDKGNNYVAVGLPAVTSNGGECLNGKAAAAGVNETATVYMKERRRWWSNYWATKS